MDEFKGMVFLQIFKWHWISVKYLTNDNIKFLYNMKQTPRNWQCQLVIYISWNHDQYFFKICIVSHSHSRIRRQHPLSISLYLNQKQKRGKWGGGGMPKFLQLPLFRGACSFAYRKKTIYSKPMRLEFSFFFMRLKFSGLIIFGGAYMYVRNLAVSSINQLYSR